MMGEVLYDDRVDPLRGLRILVHRAAHIGLMQVTVRHWASAAMY